MCLRPFCVKSGFEGTLIEFYFGAAKNGRREKTKLKNQIAARFARGDRLRGISERNRMI